MKEKIKELMLKAIEHPRPEIIQRYMLPVWNQPFFYKIDMARALTISYNPTDKGARTNYPHLVEEYKRNGSIGTERVYDLLYNFKKEEYWRRRYDLIFAQMDIDSEEIAHMDASFFPYESLDLCRAYAMIDDSKQYLTDCIELLGEQLEYIFIDGKKNKDILLLLCRDYDLIDVTSMPVNSKKTEYELLIYKHKQRNTFLIYYGCQLYGATSPSDECVLRIAKYIEEKTAL